MIETLYAQAPELIMMVVLLGCSAFFSATETALFSLTPEELRRAALTPSHRTRAIQALLRDPPLFLATVLFGNMLVNVSLFSLSFLVTLHLLSDRMHVAGTLFSLATLVVVILFGETTPKGVAVARPMAVARLTAMPMYYFFRLVSPVTVLLRRIAGAATGFFTRHFPSDPYVTRDELKMLIAMAEQQGTLDRHARGMIEQVVELATLRAKDVMTPRVDIPMFNFAAGREGLCELVSIEREERVLAYEGTADNIIGTLVTREVFVRVDVELRTLLRPVRFVPETQPVETLLRFFREAKDSVAVVVDEHGGTSGLVTLEDILEEVVGDIRHETEARGSTIQRVDEDTYVLAGDVSVRDWRPLLGAGFDPEGVGTLGGLVMSLLGRVPREGDGVQRRGLRFTVEKMHGRRIMRIRVERLRQEDAA